MSIENVMRFAYFALKEKDKGALKAGLRVHKKSSSGVARAAFVFKHLLHPHLSRMQCD